MTVTSLDAWLYGTLVARIAADDGRSRLTWTGEALRRWGLGSAVLSGLLPLSRHDPAPALAGVWLRGLLPEGRARSRLADRAGIDPDDVLAFLAVYGRDTAGAVVLVPSGTDPQQPHRPATPLDDEQIGALLSQAADEGAADLLTSIGGLEAKVTLTATGAGFAEPTPTAPSTHILKLSRPADSRSADLIDTENACLELARATGIGDVEAHLQSFAGRRAIVVRRYDRVVDDTGSITRIHQEDTAQLLGLETGDPDRKFQYGRALPSLTAIATRLDRMGVDPAALVALTTVNLAIGNTDAHAKNISVIHDADGTHRLAPAYDIAMHLHHRHADPRFAMDLAGERDVAALTARHLLDEAATWRLPTRRAVRVVADTLERLRSGLADLDRARHPGVPELAWDTVEVRVNTLLDQLPAQPVATAPRGPARPRRRHPRGTPSGGRFAPE